MKDYTHEISIKSAEYVRGNGEYTVEEKTLITYGLELLFNSLLKAVIYIFIGTILGRFTETLLVIVVFGFVRTFAGGAHMKEDIDCFVVTGILIGLGVMSPRICSKYILKHLEEVWIGLNIIYLIFTENCVCDEDYKKINISLKGKAVLVINIFIFCSHWLDDYWKVIVVSTIILEGITLIKGRSENEESEKVR